MTKECRSVKDRILDRLPTRAPLEQGPGGCRINVAFKKGHRQVRAFGELYRLGNAVTKQM